MTERVLHSYLKNQHPDAFYVEKTQPNRFFEGPIDGTILRETPFGNLVDTRLPLDQQVDEILGNSVAHYSMQMKTFARYGIRTVNPKYIIGEREVADINGIYQREPVISYIVEKIDGAIDFEQALLQGNPLYFEAYDNLAQRLLSMCSEEVLKQNKIEYEITRLPQFVIDPDAKDIHDMTVLVDVDPMSEIMASSISDSSYANFLVSLAYDLVRIANVSKKEDLQNIKSLQTLIETIKKLPTLVSNLDDIKAQVLESIHRLDENRLYTLSIVGYEEDDDYS